MVSRLVPHCSFTTSESSFDERSVRYHINLIYELSPSTNTQSTNKDKHNNENKQETKKQTNTLAALAGRSQSPWALLSCDGYSCTSTYISNAWLTLVPVKFPLNLTPAYPDRETKQKNNANKRKEKTNNTKRASRNVPAQLNTNSMQLSSLKYTCKQTNEQTKQTRYTRSACSMLLFRNTRKHIKIAFRVDMGRSPSDWTGSPWSKFRRLVNASS